MTRAGRLLDLIQFLRRHRRPVTARSMAEALEVSERTIYRDVVALQATGAPIVGEAGIGYVLGDGYELPPLMFTEEELEAVMLGLRFVRSRGDEALVTVVEDAAAKIEAVLPARLKPAFVEAPLYAPSFDAPRLAVADPADLRRAIRIRRKIVLDYVDAGGETTRRTVWPIAMDFHERRQIVVGWCELRRDFRHFRLDRIASLEVTSERYPGDRRRLIAEWQRVLAAEADAQKREAGGSAAGTISMPSAAKPA
jgi:predicted DNA-binding transcriptional regulator YafY